MNDTENPFIEASQSERIAAMKQALDPSHYLDNPKAPYESIIAKHRYSFRFHKTHTEEFRHQSNPKSETFRQHYSVSVTSADGRITESFDYFCPHTRRISDNLGPMPAKIDTDERLLGFLYCLVNDYSTIEHQEIRDGFELMKEFGYDDPLEARNTFNALQLNHTKIKRVFDSATWARIEQIVEGY